MRIRFQRTESAPMGFTTVGYWYWSEPKNRGTLTIMVCRLPWRFEAAVWGHELIEALYCKLLGITTEEADAFDEYYERQYELGTISKIEEPGDDPRCPYHRGHRMGVWWEHLWIYMTGGGWRKYDAACNKVMGIDAP